MTAHVWNAGTEREGQSNNGNLYFRGAAIYSYGSHFLLAYRMPDGTVLRNSDSYSVSTSGHQSDVRAAIRDRRYASVADLTRLESILNSISRFADLESKEHRDRIRQAVRVALLQYAPSLRGVVLAAGAHDVEYFDSDGNYIEAADRKPTPGEEVGAYLARLVGLPAASWGAIKRESDRLIAKEARRVAAADKKRAVDRALFWSDKSDRDWRQYIARTGTDYNDNQMRNHTKELKRARKLMLAATSGPLAAKSRLATIRARIKIADREVADFAERRAARVARNTLAVNIGIVKAMRDRRDWRGATWSELRDLERAATYLIGHGRNLRLMMRAAIMQREAGLGMKLIEAEASRLERLSQAERVDAWMSGAHVGRLYFDAPSGGAAMRIRGEMLETSHGAEVPLSHAIKAFRFVKLCKERGESWHRNGKTIRVGHFQVDSIEANGDFRAGCHSFTWSEIERVAKLANVAECPASADAVEPSARAA